MRRLDVRLFGSFQVSLDGEPLTAFETDKARALLAYLAVEADRGHRRESLSAMFWPDRPEAAARRNLRQTLFRLRQAIGDRTNGAPHLLVDTHELKINPASDHWLDVAEFSAQLNAARLRRAQDPYLSEGCRRCLTAAVAIYRDDLLSGFSLSGCPDFEWWLLTNQERFHRQALEALEILGRFYEQERDYPRVAEYAEQEIMLEPWLESAHRRQMRALALTGQRYAALSHYERCRQILADQLGTEPSPRTTRLFEQIRDGGLQR
jgi:DNA-binding SARP family transcriptional activator